MTAFSTQVGGEHYKKLAIQPMQYSMANNLDACQHTIIKYVTRFRDKGGVADLEKAKHVIDMLIEMESSATQPESPESNLKDAFEAAKAQQVPKAVDPLRDALIAALQERFGGGIVVEFVDEDSGLTD